MVKRNFVTVVEGRSDFNACIRVAEKGDVRPLRAYVDANILSRAEAVALVRLVHNVAQHGKGGRQRGDKSKVVRRDVNADIHVAAHEAYLAKYNAGATVKGALPFIHAALEKRGINTDKNVDRVTVLLAHPERIRAPKNNT